MPRQEVDSMVGFIRPGPVGLAWAFGEDEDEDEDFSLINPFAHRDIHHGVPGPVGMNPEFDDDAFWSTHYEPDKEHDQLAALAYGEASSHMHATAYEEMAALVNTAVRHTNAHKFKTIDE